MGFENLLFVRGLVVLRQTSQNRGLLFYWLHQFNLILAEHIVLSDGVCIDARLAEGLYVRLCLLEIDLIVLHYFAESFKQGIATVGVELFGFILFADLVLVEQLRFRVYSAQLAALRHDFLDARKTRQSNCSNHFIETVEAGYFIRIGQKSFKITMQRCLLGCLRKQQGIVHD